MVRYDTNKNIKIFPLKLYFSFCFEQKCTVKTQYKMATRM